MNNNTRRMLRLPDELYKKIEIFKKEKDITTINKAVINLIELGLIRDIEDSEIENYLMRIIKQNNYLIEIVEELIEESKS